METTTRAGRVQVEHAPAHSILTKATGFVDFFDYTLNPYAGCAFGCSYCYAAFFASTDQLKADWGKWVRVKENALDLLKKRRKRPLNGETLYMSSVTDPYQPIERELRLTRAILEELVAHHHVRLIVQTRGPLVTRDLDLLTQFEHVQVNMTITTDDDAIRKAFEPACASVDQRLAAVKAITAAGVRAMITMSPLLPVRDAEAFAEKLLATGAQRFAAQHFHMGTTRFAAGTSDEALRLAKSLQWGRAEYEAVAGVLRERLPNFGEGKAGFAPMWN